MTLSAKIEVILFARAEPLSRKELSTLLGVDEENVAQALTDLSRSLNGRGITLVEAGDSYELRTVPEAAPLLSLLHEEDVGKGIGRAGLEVLSIVLYRGALTRAEIDYIRGVNSTAALRTLLARLLIERVEGGRAPKYQATTELLAHLGLTRIEELPGYESVKARLAHIGAEGAPAV